MTNQLQNFCSETINLQNILLVAKRPFSIKLFLSIFLSIFFNFVIYQTFYAYDNYYYNNHAYMNNGIIIVI